MNKIDKNKLLFSISIGLILIWSGCVDTGVENIPTTINFRSQVRFVNEVANASATITVDGSQAGTVQSGETSAYVETASGSRNIIATYSSGPNVEGILSLETDYKITITIVEDTTGTRSFVKTLDGYIWQ
jgi:hypothetical protein